MGIREDYSKWPLGRQLQVIFISSGFLLALILIIITKFQLDWLRGQVTGNSSKVIQDNVLSHMHSLGSIEAKYLTNEFSNYIAIVKNLNRTDSMILGFGYYGNESPFQPGTPVSHDIYSDTDIDYTTGCYMSRLVLSAEGEALEIQDSSMDKVYPLIYNSNFLGLYQGYEIDEIIHYYPGYITSDLEYTPLVREWYYKAVDNPTEVIITEPYTDSTTGIWVVTVSTAILDLDGNIYGVAAADITLKTLTTKTSEAKVLELGFALLISQGGMVLAMPDSWQPIDSSTTLRIYDESNTGISETQWDEIKLLGPNDHYFFNDVNGTAYIMTKHDVTPDENQNTATHYVLICANLLESKEPINTITNSFEDTYVIIFYVTLTIGILVFLSITILIYFSTRKIGIQLKMIEKVFSKLIRRGLFPKMTRGISFEKLENNSKGIESLVDACKERVLKIKNAEERLNYYNWGSTRPNEELLFVEWSNCLYPYNFYTNEQMSWRKELLGLTKVHL